MIRIVARPSATEALSRLGGAKNSPDIDDFPAAVSCCPSRPLQLIRAKQCTASLIAAQDMRLDDMLAIGETQLQAIAATHRLFNRVECHEANLPRGGEALQFQATARPLQYFALALDRFAALQPSVTLGFAKAVVPIDFGKIAGVYCMVRETQAALRAVNARQTVRPPTGRETC
jgi:hypothetical protein